MPNGTYAMRISIIAGNQPSTSTLRTRPAGAPKATRIEFRTLKRTTSPEMKNGTVTGRASTSAGVGPTRASGRDHHRLERYSPVVSRSIHVRVLSDESEK